jgi:hypothetical protein
MELKMIALHEQDFYAWTQQQSQLLKTRQFAQLDVHYLMEELANMGASEKRELVNRLKILLTHLLKWQYQPALQSRSWLLTIEEQRLQLEDHLEDNPSLNTTEYMQASIEKAYKRALIQAEKETGLSRSTFPKVCKYSVAQIFDNTFYPPEK